MTRYVIPPSERQVRYVRGLQGKLELPDRMLDDHCVQTFGVAFDQLERDQVSALIDQLKRWVEVPADLRRRQGQTDLPGMEVSGV